MSANTAGILVCTPNGERFKLIVETLRLFGFQVNGLSDARQIISEPAFARWSILVIDSACHSTAIGSMIQNIRQQYGEHLGIVVLNGEANGLNRIDAIQHGADSYLTGPLSFVELLAVINRLLAKQNANALMHFGSAYEWQLDTATQSLCYQHAGQCQHVQLTGAQIRIIAALIATDGQVINRKTLVQCLGPGGDPDDTRRLDVIISRLRSKVKQETKVNLPLHSYRNIGYAFTNTAINNLQHSPIQNAYAQVHHP